MDSLQYRYTINESILTRVDEALRRSDWAIIDLRAVVNSVNNTTIVGGSVHGNVNTGGSQTVSQGSGDAT